MDCHDKMADKGKCARGADVLMSKKYTFPVYDLAPTDEVVMVECCTNVLILCRVYLSFG